MSDPTKYDLEAAELALATVTDAYDIAARSVAEFLANLVSLREKRATVHISPVDGSTALDLLAALAKAEAQLDSAEEQRDGLANLRRDMQKARDLSCEFHKLSTARAALPKATQDLDASVAAFASWCDCHLRVVAQCQAAGIQTSGEGWSRRLTDVLRSKGLASSFG